MYWLSVTLQAALIAYIVCSFFASIQYLWYLYYTAAYAVALRQIHNVEEQGISLSQSRIPAPMPASEIKPVRGALWPSYRRRQEIG